MMIREPAVAGQFYAGNAAELATTVKTLLDEAGQQRGRAPKAIIAPHAGYIYSGPVAATAYARLRPHRDRYERVVLLGPCHRVPVSGIALSDAEAFRTPLGDVPVDRERIAELSGPGLEVLELPHRYEHCLEVHLPFLQAVLGPFSVVPVVVGDATPTAVCDFLDRAWGGDETLIVVSSDLSHYLGYEQAKARDSATCDAIEHLDHQRIGHDDACGATPVNGLLLAARERDMNVETLDLRNSADVCGDRHVVVGYGAWVFS